MTSIPKVKLPVCSKSTAIGLSQHRDAHSETQRCLRRRLGAIVQGLKYFEDYFNSEGEKTLRVYTVPLNMSRFDNQNWLTDDATMDIIADKFGRIRKVKLLTPRMAARLQLVDPLALKAGLLGSNPDGLFKL